jgi:hypothetical protein
MQAPKKTPGGSSVGSVTKSMNRPVRQTVDTSVIESNSSKIADNKVIKPEPSSQESREPTLKEPFRFRWQKRRRLRQPVPAANKGGASKRPITDRKKATKSKGRKQVYDDDDDDFMGYGGGVAMKEESGDAMITYGDGEGSDYEENGSQGGIMTPPKSAGKIAGVRHRGIAPNRRPIPKNNGRHDGRQLVPWHSK